MGRKMSPIFKRALDLIAFSTLIPMEKIIRNPSTKLFLFKKTKRFRLLKHYNYAFIDEYEFSPSSTPLFPKARNPASKRCRLMRCLLCGVDSRANDDVDRWTEDELEIAAVVVEEVRRQSAEPLDCSEENDSVDRRADLFIERFHRQMKMQRQESALQYGEMLDRSCRYS